ncbi:MAG: hypothetical protein ACKOUS_09265 [Alphaproteobacteria bacterium]
MAELGAAMAPGLDDAAARAAAVLRPWLGRTDFLAGCDCTQKRPSGSAWMRRRA